MLSQAGEASKLQPHWKIVSHMWNIYFWVDDVDAICEEVQERGAIIDYGLGMKDYGVKEFGVQDLDEHDGLFGLTQSEILERIRTTTSLEEGIHDTEFVVESITN